MLLTIAGGVALILFAIRYLRKGLDRLFGPRLGHWVQRLTGNRIAAFGSGVGLAVLAPSSTTMSLLAVQAVQAKHASARQMLAMLYGVHIGLTVTVILITFRLEQYAPLLLLAGTLLFLFSRRTTPRGIGQVLLALSFIFMGVGIIKGPGGAGGIDPTGDVEKIIAIAANHPMVLALCAAILAVLLQSSTATIGLVIGLFIAGHIDRLEPAIAVVAGANFGIATTTLIAGWQQLESRRLAFAVLISEALVVALFLYFLEPLARLLTEIPAATGENRIAYAHLGFNLTMALVGLPLIDLLVRLAGLLIPEQAEEDAFAPRYIDASQVDSPSLALGQSAREITRVAEIVRSMLADAWKALNTNNPQLAEQVSQRDDLVDQLDMQIKHFLTRLSGYDLDKEGADLQIRQLRHLSELETVGDIIDKNLVQLVLKKIRSRAEFSPAGKEELDDFCAKVRENMVIAETASTTRNPMLARQLIRHKRRLDELEDELRDRHFQRLNKGLAESQETSAIHLDLLTYLRRVNSHITHVAYAILGDAAENEG